MEPTLQGQARGGSNPATPGRLGKYALLNVIGKGSMGVVYKSFDPHIKRPVALKTIRRDPLDDNTEDFSARFRHEAQAAGALLHPGIVAVYEYGEEGSYAYIAMEYVEGRSLRECFEKKVAFTNAQTVEIVSQLLDALQFAHERGVWHRDIKPANILIVNTDRVKVTDFGIARIGSSVLTQVGTSIMGTPGFIAPEMYLGSEFDRRVDVFAAGVVAYQLLAGVPPYVGAPEKVMFKVCYETPLPPSVAARLPVLSPYDAVVMRALARRPADRFASAALFREALLQAQSQVGGQGDEDATVIRRRAPAGGASSAVTNEPSRRLTLTGEGWNAEDLARIERRLACFVGPIARVMVRRAATETRDLVSLMNVLADKITGAAEREEFLKGSGVAEPQATVTPPRPASEGKAAGARQRRAPAGAARPLTATDIDRAAQLLAVQLGPIAPVLARRAAEAGVSREQFIATLAAYLREEGERAHFVSRLG